MSEMSIHRETRASGFWLESAVAVVGPGGRLIRADASMTAWLCSGGVGVGEEEDVPDFWEALVRRVPDWRSSVERLQGAEEQISRLRCPLEESGRSTLWFELECVRLESAWVVRLASCLPPRPELAESAWDAHLDSDGARREMFVRLLRAESRLEQLTEYWPGVIFAQRPDGSFEFVSSKVEALTGVTPPQWQRQSQWFWQVVHEADAKELERQMQEAARSGRAVTSTFRVRHLQSGRISYVLEHRQPMTSPGGLLLGYEGVWLDVTRQTIAERRLSSAAWKETLAVLTMGLAHDFGNVMAGIHSLSESFLDQLEAGHPFREGLDLIKKNSMQASHLVHRIINLHVGRTGDRNYHDLNAVVDELRDLVRKVVPRRIQIQVRVHPEQLPVYVDAVEFRQTIINLTLNAAEAMPEKGQLELATTRHGEWPAPSNMVGVVPRLPCVCLTVSDNGAGIKARYLASIFDPFFTTKSANKGSGLGLYNARLFVEKHRGAISVESVEQQGTTFRIWLPEADFSEGEREASQPCSVAARRPALLLLAGPGQPQAETAELLRTKNYHVLTAGAAEEALALLRGGDCICSALVVLIDGDDAALAGVLDAVRRQHPMLKVILKLVGRDRDDLRAGSLRQADLVVSGSAPEHTFLDQLRGLLQAET